MTLENRAPTLEQEDSFKNPPFEETIAVLINSRDGAHTLPAVILSLFTMAANPHRIKFGVRIDDDDVKTRLAVEDLASKVPVDVRIFTGPRPIHCGAEHNHMARNIAANFYTVLNDDTLCMQWEWDQVLLECNKKYPNLYVTAWATFPYTYTEIGGGRARRTHPADYQIFRRDWVEAFDMQVFPGRTPYWFDDFYMVQLHRLVTGKDLVCVPIALCARKLGGTRRMRDFPFWRSYYQYQEKYRIEEAKKIAERLGIDHHVDEEILKEQRKHTLRHFSVDKMNILTDMLGDKGEPDPHYIKSKELAEKDMQSVKTII